MAQMSPMTQCELTVTGPIARSAIAAIESRFQAVAIRTAGTTIVTVDAVDQAAVRSLMVMLWDSGHELVAMAITPGVRTAGVAVANPATALRSPDLYR